MSLAEVIEEHARRRPQQVAFREGGRCLRWAEYHQRSERLAALLVQRGLLPGDRVAVLLPDGPGVHVAYVACEKAGLVVVGIGARAGASEVRHLIRRSGARGLLSPPRQRHLDLVALTRELREEGAALEHPLLAPRLLEEGDPLLQEAAELPAVPRSRWRKSHEIFLLNSTSGITGLPKCVVHDQARWEHFHSLALEAGELGPADVFMSVLPAPFGFGLWTAHFTPTLLGAPTVLMERFDADEAIRRLAEHRVSVLAAVTTQFLMMLASPELERQDLSRLRLLFTGGEAVPAERAAEFEARTGARVLQFYGSNETGALSHTTLRDPPEVRLHSCGRVIPSMQVRLFDGPEDEGRPSGEGQPGCKGPLLSRGYWEDPEANRALFTRGGWMLTGDIARIDEAGVLRVVGRAADFIIRGGKNISAPAVEAAVASHPAVALAAAVPLPDPVFGERVCVFVELRRGQPSLDHTELVHFLEQQGISREWLPERLVVLEALPRSSGGKVAKAELRRRAREGLLRPGAGRPAPPG